MLRRLTRPAVVLIVAAAVLATCAEDDGGSPGGTIQSVEVVSQSGDYKEAVDATPSPNGETVYFTANSSTGPGVFRVPASGGTVEAVFTGGPFQRPFGIAVDPKGEHVYVSDSDAGRIFALPLAGGEPTPVPGTDGTAPRGLEVVPEGGADVLYFAGRDPSDGRPAVLKIAAGGGEGPTVVSKEGLSAPDAVTASRDGVVYATDRGPAGDGRGGGVFRIRGLEVTKLAPLRPPVLAGLTLTLDESLLLVSALSGEGTDEVLVIDLDSLRTDVFSDTIGENESGAGLHRAHKANVFAWADLNAGPDRQSRVYVLRA